MTIEIINADGIGVRALLGVAMDLHKLTVDRGITLGVIEAEALGEDSGVGFVMANRDNGSPVLGVTIEPNPRLIRWVADAEAPRCEEAHVLTGDGYATCTCIEPCCNDDEGEVCTCRDCRSPNHRHEWERNTGPADRGAL